MSKAPEIGIIDDEFHSNIPRYEITYSSTNPDSLIQSFCYATPGLRGGGEVRIAYNEENLRNFTSLSDDFIEKGFRIERTNTDIIISFRPYIHDRKTIKDIGEILDLAGQFDLHFNEIRQKIRDHVSRISGFEILPSSDAVLNIIPESFICPISHDLMENPVILSIDGQNYDYPNIVTWLKSNKSSPFTREKWDGSGKIDDLLIPNYALRFAAIASQEELKELKELFIALSMDLDLVNVIKRYKTANRHQKGEILEELCTISGWPFQPLSATVFIN